MKHKAAGPAKPNRPTGPMGPLARVLLAPLLVSLASLGWPVILEAASPQILVAAAVSLKEAFDEIGGAYKQRTGTRVTFTFGASGELEKQIEAGAPVDVFASAGEKEMRELQAKQLVEPATVANFVSNSLVLVVPASAKLRIHSFADLQQPAVKMIAIGNPKTVPAGQYAEQFLRNTHLWAAIQPRLVFAENVRQVLDYVDHGEVDAGIVYATDAAIAHGKVSVAARAPKGEYGPILYPIAVVKGSRNDQAAREFVRFVLSPSGMNILKKNGFLSNP
ncbi:MAG: molybdate ABC transporter substrate-binding protein [Terriglobia bacterium]